MLGTTAIRTAIRDGKNSSDRKYFGNFPGGWMATLEKSLADLVKKGLITMEIALSWSLRPEELTRLVRGT